MPGKTRMWVGEGEFGAVGLSGNLACDAITVVHPYEAIETARCAKMTASLGTLDIARSLES